MVLESTDSLVEVLRRYHLLEPAQLEDVSRRQGTFPNARALAGELLGRGWLTAYQVNQLLTSHGDRLVLGQYVMLDRLGRGGMGEVFKAQQRRLRRLTALKLIRQEDVASPAAVQRFHREAQAAARLSHPNIVTIYDADEAAGTHFLAMEYIDGIDLARVVKERRPLSVDQACDFIRQVALGLQHAHEHGLIHRDIKPSNLLVASATREHEGASPSGHASLTVKILDMGLARLVEADGHEESCGRLTRQGVLMGTLDFLAPEQAIDAHHVDIRADLYSLGCTFYFLLAGRAPFASGSAAERLAKHRLDDPLPVQQLRPDVPAAVATVIRKLLAKNPQDRYQTAAEVAALLEAVLHRSAATTPAPAPIRTSHPAEGEPPTVSLAVEAAGAELAETRAKPDPVKSTSKATSDFAAAPVAASAFHSSRGAAVMPPHPSLPPIAQPPSPGSSAVVHRLAPLSEQAAADGWRVDAGTQPDGHRAFWVIVLGLLTLVLAGAVFHGVRNDWLAPTSASLSNRDSVPPFRRIDPLPTQAGTPPMISGKGSSVPSPTIKEVPAKVIKNRTDVIQNSIDMELVLVPAGRFQMGSPITEADRAIDEGPQHEVTISKPFYMGRYTVTRGQFAAFVRATGYQSETEAGGGAMGYTGVGDVPFAKDRRFSWRDPGFSQTDSHPVVNVTWNDATEFCQWLSRKEGKTYRLPTEAEWEYACRAGTRTRFYCGDQERDLAKFANVADRALTDRFARALVNDWNDGYAFTAPVGEFLRNEFGLYDMHGNVWEWCEDWYAAAYYSYGAKRDPQGPAEGKDRVTRGGSFLTPGDGCRSACRHKLAPRETFPDYGFRVVCVPAPGAP